MNFIDPDRPDIAKRAGQSPLNSATEYETSESEDGKVYKDGFGYARKRNKQHGTGKANLAGSEPAYKRRTARFLNDNAIVRGEGSKPIIVIT